MVSCFMLWLLALLEIRPRAVFAGVLLCVLAVQALGLTPSGAALLNDESKAAARCADTGPDLPDPLDPPSGNCGHCCFMQPFVVFFSALVATALVERFRSPSPAPVAENGPGNLEPLGWGSSWSSQAPPAF